MLTASRLLPSPSRPPARASNGALAGLLLLATCAEQAHEQNPPRVEPTTRALGTVPPSEVAVWQPVFSNAMPDERYLESVAFDSSREVVVVFGGMTTDLSAGTILPGQQTWEWSPKTGHWTDRTRSDSVATARAGAAMVFDSARGKLVLFGGRGSSGSDLDDTWEWDPATGAWTAVSITGDPPPARSQHAMVYEKSTGKILLFGGGHSDPKSTDGTGITLSIGDTWEYDPVNRTWKKWAVTKAPTVRHGAGMAWDGKRNKVVLFGGRPIDVVGGFGLPVQDTWEWDPTAATWSERTTAGTKPSARYAFGMAYDGSRDRILVFGGSDTLGTDALRDLWELNPSTAAWTQRMTGIESGIPMPRMRASLVSDDSRARLELLGGSIHGDKGSREVWELDPTKPAFVNRTNPSDFPPARDSYTLAYNPSTGKTYLFGGYDWRSQWVLDDLWAWDGKAWSEVVTKARPPGREDTALAYDPVRKSLILFGGSAPVNDGYHSDTWELTDDWTQLQPASSPGPLGYHGMVTDTARGRLLLFGGDRPHTGTPDPTSHELWEWDGSAVSWTKRTPLAANGMPQGQEFPLLAFDEARQKLFLLDRGVFGFWEWDPFSGGWEHRDFGEAAPKVSSYSLFAYDSLRRRMVLLADRGTSGSFQPETWEINTTRPTLFIRPTTTAPQTYSGIQLAFDNKRNVGVTMVYDTSSGSGVTWEYKVTNLGNGEGCTAASATSCTSGFCVEGVCCAVAACPGACQSCNVPGSEGTCAAAMSGTVVPGSCEAGQACDGSGGCKKKNGQPCTVKSDCATGICADGVCCDISCSGTCASCKRPGREGKCTPMVVGTDPENECGKGAGVCKSTCDGVGACAWPDTHVSCSSGLTCNGIGDCSFRDPSLGGSGGSFQGTGGRGGNGGGSGGRTGATGGSSGFVGGSGGNGGIGGRAGGTGGASYLLGGSGGALAGAGGGGTTVRPDSGAAVTGGAGGSMPGTGASGGSLATRDGAVSTTPGLGGSGGSDDAHLGDAGRTSPPKSGCSCTLGGRPPSKSSWTVPFLFACVAALFWYRRRPENPNRAESRSQGCYSPRDGSRPLGRGSSGEPGQGTGLTSIGHGTTLRLVLWEGENGSEQRHGPIHRN